MQAFVWKTLQLKLQAIINIWKHKWRHLSVGQNNKTTLITTLFSILKTDVKIEKKSSWFSLDDKFLNWWIRSWPNKWRDKLNFIPYVSFSATIWLTYKWKSLDWRIDTKIKRAITNFRNCLENKIVIGINLVLY